jgi:hypothetical protein
MTRLLAVLLVGVGSFFFARPAHAQQYVVGGDAEVLTGIEGGAGGFKVPPQRARTTLRLGGSVFVDEFPKNILSAAVLLEIEPKASVGVDARYSRLLGRHFTAGVGAVGYVLPETLIGPSFDVQARLPMSKHVAFTVGPMINAFVIGSDLPDGTVVWQAMLRLGIHANL